MAGHKHIERLMKVNFEWWIRRQARGTAAYRAALSVSELGPASFALQLGQMDDPDASSVVLYLRDRPDDMERKLRDLIEAYNSAHPAE